MKLSQAAIFGAAMVVSAAAQDRMPPISPEHLSDAQKKAIKDLTAGPRGAANGPFIPAMRSPEFMDRMQKLGEYLRFQSPIEPKLREMVILMTAREWTQQYEWNAHAPLALKAGLKQDIVNAIAEGRRPTGMDPTEETVHNFITELHHNQSVSDPTYAKAVEKFGENGVIDLIGLTGYYSMLGMIMDVARTPLADGAKPALVPFPH